MPPNKCNSTGTGSAVLPQRYVSLKEYIDNLTVHFKSPCCRHFQRSHDFSLFLLPESSGKMMDINDGYQI